MALSFCTAVWPDDELKSSLNSSQSCPKRSHNSFDLIRDVFPKYSKKSPKVLDYFGQKIVKNNFQKEYLSLVNKRVYQYYRSLFPHVTENEYNKIIENKLNRIFANFRENNFGENM